jgi:hypothetical protein
MKQSNTARRLEDDTLRDAARDRTRALRGELEFSRTDLVFRLDAREIDIALRLRNPSLRRSAACTGYIEFAEFGAFLPWTPLTTFEVPPLEAGAVTIIRLRVPRPALGGAGEPPRIETRRARRESESNEQLLLGPDRWLPDLVPWMPSKQLEFSFAANLNVHVGGQSVERHFSGPTRIAPGVCNCAKFNVGDGSDAYRFSVSADPGLIALLLHRIESFERTPKPIVQGHWYDGAIVPSVNTLIVEAPWQRGGRRVAVEV